MARRSGRFARCGSAAAGVLLVVSCSGTVEASYRPPPPEPPPTTVPLPTLPTPTPAPVAACGPDQVSVDVGVVETADGASILPLLVRLRTATTCAVANPVGVELLDAAGRTLPARVGPGALPAGRVPVDAIPAEVGAWVRIGWRATPTADGDPAVDCVDAAALRVTLADGAPPIPVPAALTACDGGTLLVSPADINAL